MNMSLSVNDPQGWDLSSLMVNRYYCHRNLPKVVIFKDAKRQNLIIRANGTIDTYPDKDMPNSGYTLYEGNIIINAK